MWLFLECLIQTFLVFENLIVSFSSVKKFFSSKSVLTVAYSWHRPRARLLSFSLGVALLCSSLHACGFLSVSSLFRSQSGCVFPVWRIGAMLLCLDFLSSGFFKDKVLNNLVFLNVLNVLLVPSQFCFFTFNICFFLFLNHLNDFSGKILDFSSFMLSGVMLPSCAKQVLF